MTANEDITEMTTNKDRHAGWVRTLDETATLRAENERLTQELALVNDTLVQRTKAMHRALDKVDAARALANEWAEACENETTVNGSYRAAEYGYEYAHGLRVALGDAS